MNSWTIEWVNDWMVEWMTQWLNDWLYGWMNGWLNDWMVDWMVEWLNVTTFMWAQVQTVLRRWQMSDSDEHKLLFFNYEKTLCDPVLSLQIG